MNRRTEPACGNIINNIVTCHRENSVWLVALQCRWEGHCPQSLPWFVLRAGSLQTCDCSIYSACCLCNSSPRSKSWKASDSVTGWGSLDLFIAYHKFATQVTPFEFRTTITYPFTSVATIVPVARTRLYAHTVITMQGDCLEVAKDTNFLGLNSHH